ncbi:IS5 family transposase [Wolbachia endosymbiont (group A) of Agelastica alni]|uniref:IS5 family transposase n=1 Tax=Wolbachia endosymbiont (group A) of Agelastica alni TaxID=3066130 RepID=UPI00333EED69
MPQKMRVSNCHEYNKFLQERGNIFRYINEAIENWYEIGPKMQGGNNIYSNKVVILIHIITHLFRIGLRQTVGFIAGYLEQIGKNLQVISYSQASRRFKKLNIKINDCRIDKDNMEDIEIAIDSTSISIYNNTPGHSKENSENRKYRSYEQVKKLHVMLNINSKKAIAAKYRSGVYSDHYGACDLLEEVHAVKVLYADRAYDRHKLYELCNKFGIKTKVLPKNNATEHQKLDYMDDRNAAVRLIKSYDCIKKWKEEVNYGKRAHIEGFFSRLKQIFGFSFRNKSEVNRGKELLIKCYLLNQFTDIGMAKFEMAT